MYMGSYIKTRSPTVDFDDFQRYMQDIFLLENFLMLEIFAPNCAFCGSIHPWTFWAVPIMVEVFAVGKRCENPDKKGRMCGKIVVLRYPVMLALFQKCCAAAMPASQGNPHLLFFCKVQSWQFQGRQFFLHFLFQLGKHSAIKVCLYIVMVVLVIEIVVIIFPPVFSLVDL